MSKTKAHEAKQLEALFEILVRNSEFEEFVSEYGPVQMYVCGDDGALSKDELLAEIKIMFKSLLEV